MLILNNLSTQAIELKYMIVPVLPPHSLSICATNSLPLTFWNERHLTTSHIKTSLSTLPLHPASFPNTSSISFIHIPSRSIIIGDASKNHSFLSKTPCLSYPLSTGTCQMGTAIQSMDKITSLKDQVDTIFPAHDYNPNGVTVEEMQVFRAANPRS